MALQDRRLTDADIRIAPAGPIGPNWLASDLTGIARYQSLPLAAVTAKPGSTLPTDNQLRRRRRRRPASRICTACAGGSLATGTVPVEPFMNAKQTRCRPTSKMISPVSSSPTVPRDFGRSVMGTTTGGSDLPGIVDPGRPIISCFSLAVATAKHDGKKCTANQDHCL
jgi:hypothetical protein